MNKEERQSRMMDYLYGEMNPKERKAYESWLEEHPEDRQELESLRLSRHLLADVEEKQPQPIVFTMPKKSFDRKWLYRLGSIAAGLLLLWVFNFQILMDQGGIVLSFGRPQRLSQSQEPTDHNVAEEVWSSFLAQNRQLLESKLLQMDSSWQDRFAALQSDQQRQWKQVRNEQSRQVQQVSQAFTEQQLPRLAGLMQQLQIEQQEELQLLLVEFWNTWQETRETDLQRIDYRMTNLYQNVERNQQESEARVVNYIQNVAGR